MNTIRLLVIASNQDDYIQLFEGCSIEDTLVEVDQAEWSDILLSSYSHAGVVLRLAAAPLAGKRSRAHRCEIALI